MVAYLDRNMPYATERAGFTSCYSTSPFYTMVFGKVLVLKGR